MTAIPLSKRQPTEVGAHDSIQVEDTVVEISTVSPFSFSSRMQPWLKSRLVRKKLKGRRVVQVYVVGNVLRGFGSHSSGHSV